MEANLFTVSAANDWQYAWELMVRLLPVLIPLTVVSLVLMVTSIVSIVKKPNPWGERIIWLLIVIMLDIIGPVLYFAIGSGMLDEKYAKFLDAQSGYDPRGGGL